MRKFIQKRMRISDSSISLLLGLGIIFIIGSLIVQWKTARQRTSTGQQQEQKKSDVQLPMSYSVQAGDTLWSISQQYFKNGYNWGDISRENKVNNPDLIYPGQLLTIPDVKPIVPDEGQISSASTSQLQQINQQYTVVAGDTLWHIAGKIYGNEYRWVEIAEKNNLTNPNLIHPGNIFILP